MVVFMNAQNLHYLFSFYKMLLNSFRQLVNNLCYILKHFVPQILHSYVNDKSEVNFLSACFENKVVSGQKAHTIFKDEHDGKVSTKSSCVCIDLYMNYKGCLSKALKHFCKIPFEDIGSNRILKFRMHFFPCTFKSFCVHGTFTDTSVHAIFQALVGIGKATVTNKQEGDNLEWILRKSQH